MRLLDDVDKPEADFDTAISQRAHRPRDDGVGIARSPHRRLDLLGSRGSRRHAAVIDEAKKAGARQVSADDAGDAERITVLVLERNDGDRDRRARAANDFDRQLGVCRKNRQER